MKKCIWCQYNSLSESETLICEQCNEKITPRTKAIISDLVLFNIEEFDFYQRNITYNNNNYNLEFEHQLACNIVKSYFEQQRDKYIVSLPPEIKALHQKISKTNEYSTKREHFILLSLIYERNYYKNELEKERQQSKKFQRLEIENETLRQQICILQNENIKLINDNKNIRNQLQEEISKVMALI